MRAIEKAGTSHPERRMNTLLRSVWDTIMDPLWKERNEIKHNKDNEYDAVDDERLSARIIWYVEHRHELVNYQDQFLAEIDLSRLSRMRRETKRRWIHNLDIARNAWEVEREQKSKNQQVLTKKFGRRVTVQESGM